MDDTVTRHRDFLRSFAIFKNFHPNELLLLAQHLKDRRFKENEVIFREGEGGQSCFFVVFGAVAVLKDLPQGGHQTLAMLKSGQLFGQVSLIDGQPRSATCVSVKRSLLLELSKDDFDRMFSMKEIFAFRFQDYLTRVMVDQVRKADSRLSKLVKIARPEKEEPEMENVVGEIQRLMRSTREMGVDLDEVEYVIPEGQKRDYARSGTAEQPAQTPVPPAANSPRGTGSYSVRPSMVDIIPPTDKRRKK